MTLQESLKYRLRNIAFFTLWFIPTLSLFLLAGWTTAPFGEYLFWYALGAIIGLPVWVSVDMIRAKRK